ncbi:MAG: hypothetical protein V2A79_19785, partial [Planctomycetota bacterium]
MYTYRTIICSLLSTVAAAAAEQPSDLSTLLADAPADALAVVYLQRPADLLTHPLWLEPFKDDVPPPALEALQVLAALFDGPTAVVVTGSPLRPDLLAVTLTAKVSMDREAFFKALDQQLLAALNRVKALPGAGAIGFDRTGDLAIVRVPTALPVHLTFALRDGYVRAGSNRALVDAWLTPPPDAAGEKPKTFPDSDDFKRLVPNASQPPDLLLYVNCRSLIPMAQLALREFPQAFDLLGLQQVEAAGLTAAWSEGRTTADLTVCLADAPSGVMQLFQSADRPVNVARLFLPDTVFMVGGKFESGAALTERVNEFLNLVDPEIVQEYEQERSEFLGEFGFDIQADFLGNFVDEWAVAVRPTEGRLPEPTLAVRLGDPAVFDAHLRALAGAFDLKFDVTAYREVNVFKPLSARITAAYGVVGDYLVVGPDVAAVCRMVDAWHDHKSLNEFAAYRTMAERWVGGASLFGYVNVSKLMGLALQNDELQLDSAAGVDEQFVEGLRQLAAGDAAVGLTLGAAPGRLKLALELAAGEQNRLLASKAFGLSIGASLARARELSKRTASVANLAGIANAAKIHAGEHKGEWPASLAELLQSGAISLEALRNPYDGTAPRTLADADRESYYLCRKNIPKGVAATEVVAGEREIRRGEGANFAYADGHV